MKKTYIKPEMEMETIELEGLLASSPLTIDISNSAKTDEDDDFVGSLMEGNNRNTGDWGGLW